MLWKLYRLYEASSGIIRRTLEALWWGGLILPIWIANILADHITGGGWMLQNLICFGGLVVTAMILSSWVYYRVHETPKARAFLFRWLLTIGGLLFAASPIIHIAWTQHLSGSGWTSSSVQDSLGAQALLGVLLLGLGFATWNLDLGEDPSEEEEEA
jgi:hypothetical protein